MTLNRWIYILIVRNRWREYYKDGKAQNQLRIGAPTKFIGPLINSVNSIPHHLCTYPGVPSATQEPALPVPGVLDVAVGDT